MRFLLVYLLCIQCDFAPTDDISLPLLVKSNTANVELVEKVQDSEGDVLTLPTVVQISKKNNVQSKEVGKHKYVDKNQERLEEIKNEIFALKKINSPYKLKQEALSKRSLYESLKELCDIDTHNMIKKIYNNTDVKKAKSKEVFYRNFIDTLGNFISNTTAIPEREKIAHIMKYMIAISYEKTQ